MLEKHRPVARVTRKGLEEGMSEGPIRSAILRDLNLDVYDAVEGLVALNPSNGDTLITFSYMGREHTLPRYCVELISRYEIE